MWIIIIKIKLNVEKIINKTKYIINYIIFL